MDRTVQETVLVMLSAVEIKDELEPTRFRGQLEAWRSYVTGMRVSTIYLTESTPITCEDLK